MHFCFYWSQTVKRTLLATFCVLAAATASRADSLLIQSGTPTDGTAFHLALNSENLATTHVANVILTPPHPAWAPAIGTSDWISFTNDYSPTPSGQSACSTPTYAICNNDFVAFYHTFTLSNPASYSGVLQVMADDTADVWLNGHQLFAALGPYSSSNTYPTCSSQPVGCLSNTMGVVTIDSSWLVSGTNTLEFKVWQRNGTGYGLDYSMSLSSVPEPGSVSLIACGLVALIALRRKQLA